MVMYTPDGAQRTPEEVASEAARVKEIAQLLISTGYLHLNAISGIEYVAPFSNTLSVQKVVNGEQVDLKTVPPDEDSVLPFFKSLPLAG